MKNRILDILLFLIIIFFSNSDKLFGQIFDYSQNFEHSQSCLFSLSFGTSPLLHTTSSTDENAKSYVTSPTGLFFSLRSDKETGLGFSTGLLLDLKRYYYERDSAVNWGSTNLIIDHTIVKVHYSYLYIPILLNYYFRNNYVFAGGMIGTTVFVSGENSKDFAGISDGGFQIGYGKIFSINNSNLSLQVEPYLILDDGSTGKALSSIGINLKLSEKVIRF